MRGTTRRQLLVALAIGFGVASNARVARAVRPASIHPVIAAFKRQLLRHGPSGADRQQIDSIDIANTANGNARVLAFIACDNTARIVLPAVLDSLGRNADSAALRALDPISDTRSARVAAARLRDLAQTLDQAAGCEGAACASNEVSAAARMTHQTGAACDLAAQDDSVETRIAEQAASAIDEGLRVTGARAAIVQNTAALILAMVATAR